MHGTILTTRRNLLKTAVFGAAAFTVSGPATAEKTDGDDVPVCFSADVCVLGGSTTGVFAAVRAAEKGMRVAIVENEGFFGGTAVGGYVPIWHSLYDTTGRTQIISGLTDRIERELVKRREAVMKNPASPSAGAILNVQALSFALDSLVSSNPLIRPFLHARVVAARKNPDGRVTHAIIEDKDGRRAIAAKFFIDATGDADFAVQAGLPTWKHARTDMQAHTTCAILSGIDSLSRRRKDFSFGKILGRGGEAALDHSFWWGCEVVGCPSLTFFAGTRISKCDPSSADDLTRGEMEGRAQLKKIVDAVNRRFPLGKGRAPVAVAAVAPMMGIRESRHIDALYRVTKDDVLSGKRFDDVVARGSYRIDIHEGEGITFFYLDGRKERMVATENGKVKWEKSRWSAKDARHATWYEIPYRALVPKGSVNVICAGRMIDASREAYGAIRVMVNCNQMGESAGLAAARAVKEGLAAADAYDGSAIPAPGQAML